MVNASSPPRRWPLVLSAAVLSLVSIAAILYIVISPAIRDSLAETEVARGIITSAFTLGTMVIAVVLTLYALLNREENPENASDRFYKGKEVLLILVGILGTIVGFYFGTSDSDMQESGSEEIQIATIKVTESSVALGNTTTIVASIIGGEMPYTYNVIFDPEIVENIEKKNVNDPIILETISIPTDITQEEKFVEGIIEVGFTIHVRDDTGQDTMGTGTFVVTKEGSSAKDGASRSGESK